MLQLQAKAVMERDLRNIRKKRAERDRARDRANGIPSPGALAKEAEEADQQANASALEDAAQAHVLGEGEETLMDEHGNLVAKADEDKVIGTGQGMPQDSENSAGLAITMSSDTATNGQDQPKNEDQQHADGMNASDAMMDTSDAANVEFFESMFNDDLVSADDSLNFGDFGFPMDTNTNQPLNSDTALQNSSLPNIDMNNLTSTSNEDINSLLPGLENYVTGSDFSNINIPTTSSNQPDTNQVTTTTTTNAAGSAPPAPDATGPTTTIADNSTLDDSFFDFNFDMNNNGGDDMGNGTLDDFDSFDWN